MSETTTEKKRTISIGMRALETANYFGGSREPIATVRQAWINALQDIGVRDGYTINFEREHANGRVIAVAGLDWDERVLDTPEELWFDKASDEALAIACRSSERPVTAICITVAGGNIMSVHANTDEVAILIRDMDNIERGDCDPLIGYALQAKDPADVYGLAGYPAEVL